MIKTNRPESIMITIRNRKTNKSTSFTVYGATIEEVKEIIENALNRKT